MAFLLDGTLASNTLLVGFIAASARLRRSSVGLRGPSVDLRGPYMPVASDDLPSAL